MRDESVCARTSRTQASSSRRTSVGRFTGCGIRTTSANPRMKVLSRSRRFPAMPSASCSSAGRGDGRPSPYASDDCRSDRVAPTVLFTSCDIMRISFS